MNTHFINVAIFGRNSSIISLQTEQRKQEKPKAEKIMTEGAKRRVQGGVRSLVFVAGRSSAYQLTAGIRFHAWLTFPAPVSMLLKSPYGNSN